MKLEIVQTSPAQLDDWEALMLVELWSQPVTSRHEY